MNTKKRVLGLALCLGMLLSIGAIQQSVSAEAGWAIASMTESDKVSAAAVGGAVGAATMGFALEGAAIGSALGPVGIVGGAIIGAL